MSKKEGVASEDLKNKKADKTESFNDEVVRSFSDILDDDEKIVVSYKPDKFKTFFSNIFMFAIIMVLFIGFIVLACLIPSEDASASTLSELWVAIGTFIGVFVVIVPLEIIFVVLWYKHTIYVVTEKRIIIRTGIIGVDYKSLELVSIGAADVYVSWIDKMIRKNTGSLRFGSNSSPISGRISTYNFTNIKNPYEVYKTIKTYIGKAQKTAKE